MSRMAWLGLGAVIFAAVVTAAVVGSPGAEKELPKPYGQREDVAAYLDTLVSQHEFDRATLQSLFENVRQRQEIVERISRPAEKVWTWGRYKKHLVDEKRIAGGVEFWQQHASTLDRAAKEYGVAPEIVLAILGIETRYGKIMGHFPVIEALTTLGFDYPPRAKFFRKELTEFLLLTREEGKDPSTLKGSYAGAMGYGQFIPSSYRHYAVDFDDDGVRDIWLNPEDAIGSIANYFYQHKWRGEGPVALRVEVRGSEIDTLVGTGLKLKYSVGELQQKGVIVDGLDPSLAANIYKLETDDGVEYWLALHDFYVITRYNRSYLYALAVELIARGIRERYLATEIQTADSQ